MLIYAQKAIWDINVTTWYTHQLQTLMTEFLPSSILQEALICSLEKLFMN